MNNFGRLPPEVQSTILRSDKSLKPTSLHVNKAIYNQSIYKIYEDDCNREITEKEVKYYINNYKPLFIGKFYFDKGDHWIYIAYISSHDGNMIDRFINVHQRDDKTLGEIVVGNNVNPEYIQHYKYKMTGQKRFIPISYDLLTMYNIYSIRFSCMNINSNYAKDKVLAYFDEKMRNLSAEDLLIFLRVNAKILGINTMGYDDLYQAPYRMFIRDEEINRKIEEEVNVLEKLVHDRLKGL